MNSADYLDEINKIENQIKEIYDKYEDAMSNIGFLELENNAKEIDNLRENLHQIYQEFDSNMHRNENGQFSTFNYDIKDLAEIANKVNEVDDLSYDTSTDIYSEANKKRIMYEGKEFRRNQIRSLARYYDIKTRNTEKIISDLKSKKQSSRNSIDIDIYEGALEKYKSSFDELNDLVNELENEMDIIQNGGTIDYATFYENDRLAEEYMSNEGLLDEELENQNKRKKILDDYKEKEEELDIYHRQEKQNIGDNSNINDDKNESLDDESKLDIDELDLPPEPNIDMEENNNYQNQNAILPVKKGNKPKLTWKTIASVAAGIAIGSTVFFTTGPLGVGVMMISGGIAKKLISNQEKKLATMTSLNEKTSLADVAEPSNKLKGPIGRLKDYLKSPEGLRDMKWMINSAMITAAGLSIGQAASQIIGNVNATPITEAPALETPELPITETLTTEPTVLNPTTPEVPLPEMLPPEPSIATGAQELGLDGIRLGDSIGNYNVTTGYDTATWALNGQNAEVLNTNIINSANSQFGRFRVYNPDGTKTIIDSVGTSIQDLINQGYTTDQIAIDVMNKGQSQAWVNVSEIIGKGKQI